MTSAIAEIEPDPDLPDPQDTQSRSEWALDALKRVLEDKPERLDWLDVDDAAQREREDRLIGLSARSARAPYPLAQVHAELDRMLDECFNPPTASALSATTPRSEVSVEMEGY